MKDEITSPQNKYIKNLLQLSQKRRVRKKTGTFLIEGRRELQLAIKGKYEILTIYFCKNIVQPGYLKDLKNQVPASTPIIGLSIEVYEKVAYRGGTEGIIVIAKSKILSFANLKIPENNSLILVAEAPEKPGNIGALLRTADAVNADAFMIANPKTDMYNPNIIRSSIGCVFTNTVATGTTSEIITFLRENNIQIISAALQNAVNYATVDYQKSTAIIVGTEDKGLSSDWISNADQVVKIPMKGVIDSMNVSVAAGILLFEADRQRTQNRI